MTRNERVIVVSALTRWLLVYPAIVVLLWRGEWRHVAAAVVACYLLERLETGLQKSDAARRERREKARKVRPR